ncbi:hypothetical protein V5O48_010200 [Marasmius crinis-equi]|uniref:Uncharacterized protein n=1 Tax=Marasmius crinis-equi TaxID=585013 RepID=A0ABR3F9M8_9AGAR
MSILKLRIKFCTLSEGTGEDCTEVLLEFHEDMLKCILSGWEVWRVLKERSDILFTPRYHSSSPDFPGPSELVEYMECYCKKQAEEQEPQDESSALSDDNVQVLPTKRARTRPCQDIVKKIERRNAENAAKKAAEKLASLSEDEE